jgi:hypothetical protein
VVAGAKLLRRLALLQLRSAAAAWVSLGATYPPFYQRSCLLCRLWAAVCALPANHVCVWPQLEPQQQLCWQLALWQLWSAAAAWVSLGATSPPFYQRSCLLCRLWAAVCALPANHVCVRPQLEPRE